MSGTVRSGPTPFVSLPVSLPRQQREYVFFDEDDSIEESVTWTYHEKTNQDDRVVSDMSRLMVNSSPSPYRPRHGVLEDTTFILAPPNTLQVAPFWAWLETTRSFPKCYSPGLGTFITSEFHCYTVNDLETVLATWTPAILIRHLGRAQYDTWRPQLIDVMTIFNFAIKYFWSSDYMPPSVPSSTWYCYRAQVRELTNTSFPKSSAYYPNVCGRGRHGHRNAPSNRHMSRYSGENRYTGGEFNEEHFDEEHHHDHVLSRYSGEHRYIGREEPEERFDDDQTAITVHHDHIENMQSYVETSEVNAALTVFIAYLETLDDAALGFDDFDDEEWDKICNITPATSSDVSHYPAKEQSYLMASEANALIAEVETDSKEEDKAPDTGEILDNEKNFDDEDNTDDEKMYTFMPDSNDNRNVVNVENERNVAPVNINATMFLPCKSTSMQEVGNFLLQVPRLYHFLTP
jgi:hypothetical protein